MAIFPKVEKHCPVKNELSAYMDGDNCRMCKRQVHNLNAMEEVERAQFLASCETEICVSYRLPKPRRIGVAIAAAAMMGVPVAAQELEPTTPPPHEQVEGKNTEQTKAENVEEMWEFDTVIVGGIKNPSKAEYIDTQADLEIPELPVVFEDEELAVETKTPTESKEK